MGTDSSSGSVWDPADEEEEEEESFEASESEEWSPEGGEEESFLSEEENESESRTSSSYSSVLMVRDPQTGAERELTDYYALTKAQSNTTELFRSRFDTKLHELTVLAKERPLPPENVGRSRSKEKSGYQAKWQPTQLFYRAQDMEPPKAAVRPLDFLPSDLWDHVRDGGEDRAEGQLDELVPEDDDDDDDETSKLIEEILLYSSELAKSGKSSKRRPREFLGSVSGPAFLVTQQTKRRNFHENPFGLSKTSNGKPLHEGQTKMELRQLDSWNKLCRAREASKNNLSLDNQFHHDRVQRQGPKTSTMLSSELIASRHGQQKKKLRAKEAAQENIHNSNVAFRRRLQRTTPKVDDAWN